MAIVGRGRIVIWEGASLWVFTAERDDDATDFHAHHAIQLTLSLGGDFELRTRDTAERGPAVAVESDCEHQFVASGTNALLFIEPESGLGRTLRDRWFSRSRLHVPEMGPLRPMIRLLADLFAGNGRDSDLVRCGQAMVDALSDRPAADPSHPRIERMIRYVSEHLDGSITLADAASRAALSPGRASHLFVEQTGLAFRTYVLWRRVQRAVELYSGGAPLTLAAHESGFSDSAHLSRTFRRMFGLPAASLRIIDAS